MLQVPAWNFRLKIITTTKLRFFSVIPAKAGMHA